MLRYCCSLSFFFFFNDTATTEIYTLSLHDALPISWVDGNSNNSIGNRKGADTTVNAAVLTGIVPSGGGDFSGGLENVLRLLEDWTSHTLTYNGSLVVFFPSQIATASWWNDGSVYWPPTRAFSFDTNFKDNTKLPPGTPWVRTIIRAGWNITQANSTQ